MGRLCLWDGVGYFIWFLLVCVNVNRRRKEIKIGDLYTHLLSSGVIMGLNKKGKRSKIDESCPTFSETGIFLSLRLEHLLMA